MDAADDASIVPAPMPDRTLVDLAATLRDRADRLRFGPPVACVYNPLRYAWEAHKLYLERFGRGPKRVVFLGMNPGPWGMVQTGVPFGEVAVVRAWMRLEAKVAKPAREHPKRDAVGFHHTDCCHGCFPLPLTRPSGRCSDRQSTLPCR